LVLRLQKGLILEKFEPKEIDLFLKLRAEIRVDKTTQDDE